MEGLSARHAMYKRTKREAHRASMRCHHLYGIVTGRSISIVIDERIWLGDFPYGRVSCEDLKAARPFAPARRARVVVAVACLQPEV